MVSDQIASLTGLWFRISLQSSGQYCCNKLRCPDPSHKVTNEKHQTREWLGLQEAGATTQVKRESSQPYSTSGIRSRQRRPTLHQSKGPYKPPGHRQLSQGSTNTQWHQGIKTRFNSALRVEQRCCTTSQQSARLSQKSGFKCSLYYYYLHGFRSLNLSGTALTAPKRIMSLILPISQDYHNNEMGPYMCECWVKPRPTNKTLICKSIL